MCEGSEKIFFQVYFTWPGKCGILYGKEGTFWSNRSKEVRPWVFGTAQRFSGPICFVCSGSVRQYTSEQTHRQTNDRQTEKRNGKNLIIALFCIFAHNSSNAHKYFLKGYVQGDLHYTNTCMIVRFSEGDLLQMKKKHPCGSEIFEVLRVGSDLRIRCTGCGRDVTVPRVKLEPNIRKVLPKAEKN